MLKFSADKKTQAWSPECPRKGMKKKKALVPESEALSASRYFSFIKVYVTTFYVEHFHSAFCTDPLKMHLVLNR